MRAILLGYPSGDGAPFFDAMGPLALVPALGRTLIDLALAGAVRRGATSIIVLAHDRPDQIRAAVGQGQAWGLDIDVLPIPKRLTTDEARARFHSGENWLPAPDDVLTLDMAAGADWTGHLDDPVCYFEGLLGRMGQACGDRIGMREVMPGVFVGTRAKVSDQAVLKAPCWIGQKAWIASGATVGPDAVVEGGACIDRNATVERSWIGPDTYVGALTEVADSMAWANHLLSLKTGSTVELRDAFLLGGLGKSYRPPVPGSWAGRTAALLALALTWPIVLVAWLRRSKGQPLLASLEAVHAPTAQPATAPTLRYRQLNGAPGVWRRWPELVRIARGEFVWFGNRPLTRDQATSLADDFERLWLATPTGLFSLADALGHDGPFDDEARVHAAFHSVQAGRNWDARMLRSFLRSLVPS